MTRTTLLLVLAAATALAGSPLAETGLAAQDPAAAGATDPGAPPLLLAEVLDLAGARNPHLLARRAVSAASATRVAEASTLPDPVLQLGVMNVGLPDLNADMAGSMAPSIQLMQMIPFPGKLGLAGDIAGADAGIADARAAEAWWEVRGRAADIFYELYALDRRTEVMRETLGLLESFRTIAQAMYAAGSGRQADVLRADVEVARMDGEIRTMEAMRAATAARLNGLLDRPAGAPVASPALAALPAVVPSGDTLNAWARESRPLLLGGRLGVARADAGVDLARRELWPDLTVGVAYGQRDAGMGTERMGSAMIGFSLPVHASKRQLAAREEAGAMKRMAEAELGGMEAEVDARIGEMLAELGRARSLIGLYRDEVLPEARATVESALSSYRVGAVDFMTLVDAQMTVNRFEGELHQLLADYGKAVAGLESAVGRALPRTDPTLVATVEAR